MTRKYITSCFQCTQSEKIKLHTPEQRMSASPKNANNAKQTWVSVDGLRRSYRNLPPPSCRKPKSVAVSSLPHVPYRKWPVATPSTSSSLCIRLCDSALCHHCLATGKRVRAYKWLHAQGGRWHHFLRVCESPASHFSFSKLPSCPAHLRYILPFTPACDLSHFQGRQHRHVQQTGRLSATKSSRVVITAFYLRLKLSAFRLRLGFLRVVLHLRNFVMSQINNSSSCYIIYLMTGRFKKAAQQNFKFWVN